LCCEDYHVCADHDRFNFEKRRETITVFDICRLAILLADSILLLQTVEVLRFVSAEVQKSDLKIVFGARYSADFGFHLRTEVFEETQYRSAAREVPVDLNVQYSSTNAKSIDWCYTSGL
jgi:hypothetical protein